MDVPLRESVAIFLDASGNITAKVGPISAREKWILDSAHVQVSTNVLEAVCNVYVGDSPIQINFRGGTFSGSSGDQTDLGDIVPKGQFVWAVWTGGDIGSQATLTVIGTKSV